MGSIESGSDVARATGEIRISSAKADKKNLTIESSIDGTRLEIIVKDTGLGISSDEMKKIFEPLYSTKETGVGLGMPRVKQVMEQHGGGIEVESIKGKGTEVKLWLPIPD